MTLAAAAAAAAAAEGGGSSSGCDGCCRDPSAISLQQNLGSLTCCIPQLLGSFSVGGARGAVQAPLHRAPKAQNTIL